MAHLAELGLCPARRAPPTASRHAKAESLMASKTEWTADKGDRSAACKGLRLQHADAR
jgi:hypothetical protein